MSPAIINSKIASMHRNLEAALPKKFIRALIHSSISQAIDKPYGRYWAMQLLGMFYSSQKEEFRYLTVFEKISENCL